MSDFEMPPSEKKSKSKVATMAEAAKDPIKSNQETENSDSDVVVKPTYNSDELLKIFDDMIFAGGYSESVTIRGRLKVAFRTRTAEEMDAITQKIDGTSAVLMATLVEKRNLLNLYYALTSYQGKDLNGLKLEEKTNFINKLPAPVVGMMMVSLYTFDMKIQEATKEGEANF